MASKNNYPSAQKPEVTPAQVSETFQALEKVRRLPQIDKADPVALESRIREYFQICIDSGLLPSVEGMRTALNISRMGLWKIEQEETKRGEVIRSAKNLLSAMLEQWQLRGAVKETTAIWLQKNYYGFKDVLEITATTQAQPLNELPGKSEIIRRLPGVVPGEVDETELINMLEEHGTVTLTNENEGGK